MSGCRPRRCSERRPLCLASAGLAAAALLSCSPVDARGPCGLTRELLVIGGQDALILTPPGLEPEAEAPLVIYHHGRGEDWNAIESRNNLLSTMCALGAAGYVIAGSHAHGNNWGNQEAIDDYVALHDMIAAERPIRDVMFLSVSMGGLSGLVTLARGVIPDVRAWIGIAPVTNLGYFYFDDDEIRPQVEAAYGGPPDPEHDPMALDPAVFRGVPMLLWASYEDETVPRTENADRFLEHLGEHADAQMITLFGSHGGFSEQPAFSPDEVVAFFDSHRTGPFPRSHR